MDAIAGFLIRYHRLRQNISQEGLCKGICVVSYLSKIEQGSVMASDEIIHKLFQSLHMEYHDDETFLREARQQLYEYFEKLFLQEDTKEAEGYLQNQYEKLLCSPLCVDILLAHRFITFDTENQQQEFTQIDSFYPMMTEEQRFLYHYLRGHCGSIQERIAQLRKAGNYITNSIQKYALANACYLDGQHAQAIEYLHAAYHLASEEGNAVMMLDSSMLLGNCYANNHDAKLMRKYYSQCVLLARTVNKEDRLEVIMYNLGSSYLSWRQLDDAERFLLKSIQTHHESNEPALLLTYQKLALLYYELKNEERMHYYMEKMDGCLTLCKRELYQKMNTFVHLHCEYKRDEEYVECLESLVYDSCYPYGFRSFHAVYLLDYYQSHRRYKEALAVIKRYHLSDVS